MKRLMIEWNVASKAEDLGLINEILDRMRSMLGDPRDIRCPEFEKKLHEAKLTEAYVDGDELARKRDLLRDETGNAKISSTITLAAVIIQSLLRSGKAEICCDLVKDLRRISYQGELLFPDWHVGNDGVFINAGKFRRSDSLGRIAEILMEGKDAEEEDALTLVWRKEALDKSYTSFFEEGRDKKW